MTRADFNLPAARSRQMDLAIAAGLSLEELDVLIEARAQLRAGGPIWIGVGDGTDAAADEAAGARLLQMALDNPAAAQWDALAVAALRRELRA